MDKSFPLDATGVGKLDEIFAALGLSAEENISIRDRATAT